MMRIFSLPYGLFIVLSLLAVKAEAQIDSNAIVHIYIGSITGGCTVDAKCGSNPDEYDGFTTSMGSIAFYYFPMRVDWDCHPLK
jgi:hypothetical protein